jgi:predicted DNA-binding ribbon-helix-helix protein
MGVGTVPTGSRVMMKSPVVKRSVIISGHKTSVSLEDEFWKGLKAIAASRQSALSDLVASIDEGRRYGNLSSAIRLFVLDHFQTQLKAMRETEVVAEITAKTHNRRAG